MDVVWQDGVKEVVLRSSITIVNSTRRPMEFLAVADDNEVTEQTARRDTT